jgi:deoxyribose-phosphate aldolase
VQTSTGYGIKGATVEDIEVLHKAVGNLLGIKAAGGIRTYGKAAVLIEAGANRIGTKHKFRCDTRRTTYNLGLNIKI